jgi:DNA-binding protein HU-beta
VRAGRRFAAIRRVLPGTGEDRREENDVNQGDLADTVAEATGAKKAEAAKVVEAVLDAIKDGLKRGEKVAISGFGSFEPSRREARQGRNPRTGEAVEIAASTTIKFKPGKGLKDALNGSGTLSSRFSR